MKKIKTLQCFKCGKEYNISEAKYTCICGGNLQVLYDYNLVKKRLSYEELKENKHLDMWRYIDLLPVEDLKVIPDLHIGFTPLYKEKALAEKMGIENIYVKDDGRNPSASFKDRASAVISARAVETDQKIICAASTGNTASSLACVTAKMDIKTVIFVPEKVPEAKMAQLMVYGANVIKVKGNYDAAFDLCVKASEEFGWYNRNSGYNPYTREGKKTCAFEICEQLEWEVPDWVFVPVGDGNIISGIWKGFLEFKKIGFIEKLPRLMAVQAEKSSAVKNAFETDKEIQPVSGETIADSISVSLPRDGFAAVMAIKDSHGKAIAVSDEEILKAIPELARETGVFAEPAAASVYAALKKAVSNKIIDKGESVLLLITGNGLKDIKSATKNLKNPYTIKPDIKSLKDIVIELKLA